MDNKTIKLKIMKKIIISLVCLVIVLTEAKTQVTTTTKQKFDADLLFKKSKKQKTAGWILLSSGMGLAITGFILWSKEASEQSINTATTVITFGFYNAPEPKQSGLTPAFIGIGGGAMLTSIPFFISSGKNKRKANLMIKDQKVFFNPFLNMKNHMPSIAVKIIL
jgi:hypothetical protein